MKQSYGLTEASPVVALTPESLNCSAQVGFPLPNTELRIVDENLKNLGPNEVGLYIIKEICVILLVLYPFDIAMI